MLRKLVPLVLVGGLVFVVGRALALAGLPSTYLFGALLAGLAVALVDRRARVAVPPPAFTAAQAVLGVTLGAYVQSSSLEALAGSWLPVAGIAVATLLLSVGAGIALSRTTSLDGPTCALGMVAGGASGIVAMARELGADDRQVAFMQYLRVLVVVFSVPLLVALVFPGHHGPPPNGELPLLGAAEDWLLTAAIAVTGAAVGRRAGLPAAMLLGPMVLSAALVLTVLGGFAVPPLAREVAFALIGLQVGLRFTPAAVREVGRLLAPVLTAIVVLIAGSFALAALLDLTTSATLLDAYLATTPGGMYAVLAIGFDTGADTTFVLAMQTLRLFVMVLLAPLAVRWTTRLATGAPATRA